MSCTNPIVKRFPASVHERLLGIQSDRELLLPCGKCAECLRKRQNDLATRVYQEAEARGCATFVTLTYKPSCVPVAQSLWTVNRDTGEFSCQCAPELVADSERASILRGQFVEFHKNYSGPAMVYKEAKNLSDIFPTDFFVRYTPTLYYEDVKLALKRFRKKHPVYKFTYVAVGEYGSHPKHWHLPHYHLIFFGLGWYECNQFVKEWTFGHSNVKSVSRVNSDRSDGLAKVARYVGKYCSKGAFDVYTAKTGCTLKNRLRSSKGLGTSKLNYNYFLAKDVAEYDINNPYTLPKDTLDKVVETIADRMFITIDGFHYAIPISIRRKIFGFQRTDSKKFVRPEAFRGKHFEIFEKAIYAPIYYLVANFLRDRSLAESDSKFRQFLSHYDPEDISGAVTAFEANEARSRATAEAIAQASILKFYQQHSKL